MGTYDYWSEEASCICSYVGPPIVRLVREQGDVRKILDAGCGNGWLAASLTAAGYQVSGIEQSETGVQFARRQVPNGDFRVASVYDDLTLQFDQVFDVVVSTEVIEHLYDPRLFLRRMRDVLKPRGILILTTPYHGYLKNLVLAATGRLDAHFTALWDGGHIKFWSYKTLRMLLEECGFDFLSFHGAGRFPFLWKSMIMVGGKRPDSTVEQ